MSCEFAARSRRASIGSALRCGIAGPTAPDIGPAESSEVVFGHRRLAILDLSEAGAQPMVDAASGCVDHLQW